MKKLFTYGMVAAAVVAVTGCSSQDFSDLFSGGDQNTIHAIIDDEGTARSEATEDGIFTWSTGDAIAVLHGESAPTKYTLSSGAGSADAQFSAGLTAGTPGTYAVYPYNENDKISDNELTVYLPDSYTYEDNEKKDGLLTNTNAPMLGTLTDGAYTFHHLAGVVRFTFNMLPAGAAGFKFTSSDSRITGEFSVDLSSTEEGSYPELKKDETTGDLTGNTVTISFNELSTPITSPRFMIPLPVGDYKGFTVAVLDKDGNILKDEYGNGIILAATDVTIPMQRRRLAKYTELNVSATLGGSINTAEALQEAIADENTQTIMLTADIDISNADQLVIPEGKTVTLNLNNHTLTTAGTVNHRIKVAGDLTINGGLLGGGGKIVDAATSDNLEEGDNLSALFWVGNSDDVDNSKGSITLESGTITANTYFAILRGNSTLTFSVDRTFSPTVATGSYGIIAWENSVTNINNGTLKSPDIALVGGDNSVFNIASGSVIAGDPTATATNASIYAAQMSNYAKVNVKSGSIQSEGYGIALFDHTNIDVDGGSITANSFAITGNGNYVNDDVAYNLNGGTIKSNNDYAVYLPHLCVTTIDGAEIIGEGGITIQRGSLFIKGSSTITANGTVMAEVPAEGDGTNGLYFAAICASARYGEATVDIEDGTITAKGSAKLFDNTYNNAAAPYTSTINAKGGSYSADPSNYIVLESIGAQNFVPSGYVSTLSDGVYKVTKSSTPTENYNVVKL